MMAIWKFAGFAVFASISAIGMWALGQWLRKKGYGPQLDTLDRHWTALQLRLSPLAMSASYRMFCGAQALNRLPLLGSRNSAVLNQQALAAIRLAQEAQRGKDSDNH